MINASIEGMRQAISFVDGSITNELLIRLPNGQQINAAVDADAMQQVTVAFAEQGGPAVQRAAAESANAPQMPTPQRSPANQSEPPVVKNPGGLELEQGDNQEFGGDYAGPPETANAAEWVASTPTSHAAAATPLRVSSDAKGNPVIQGGNVREHHEMAGGVGASLEDDGVGSV